MGHKSPFQTRGEAANPRRLNGGDRTGCRTEADDKGPKEPGYQVMRPLPSVPLPGISCPGCYWPGMGRFGEENQASSRLPTSTRRRVAGAAAGGSSWCLSLEPHGCVCLNPSSLEPPRLAGGLIRQKGGNGSGWGAEAPPQAPRATHWILPHAPSPSPVLPSALSRRPGFL